MFENAGQDGFLRPTNEEKRISSAFLRQASFFKGAASALLALSLAACQEEVTAEKVVRPVKAIVVAQETGEQTKSFSGNIKARTESALGFRIAGKITERKVDIGDRVKTGQIIARLDDTDLVLSQNSARAALQSAKTRLTVATDALDRATKLQPKGYTPNSVVDQRKLEVDAAEAALQAAEAQARQTENATGYAVLRANQDGIITSVQAEAGQVVAAGTPVVTVAESGDMEVALSVPEQDVTQLEIGQQAQLRLWADANVEATGKISEIAGQADPASRTYAVRVVITDPPPAMRLGMTATATLSLNSQSPYVALPLPALTQIGGRKAVYVADRTSSKVSPRFVETGGVTDETVKVVSGLQPGEVVVTGGVQFLTDGQFVRLPDSVVQTASAPQSQVKLNP